MLGFVILGERLVLSLRFCQAVVERKLERVCALFMLASSRQILFLVVELLAVTKLCE